jgi:hypothetical protein
VRNVLLVYPILRGSGTLGSAPLPAPEGEGAQFLNPDMDAQQERTDTSTFSF